jgi:hypothetical protein
MNFNAETLRSKLISINPDLDRLAPKVYEKFQIIIDGEVLLLTINQLHLNTKKINLLNYYD